ncbi:Uncharacterised protein [Escherichia coli]|nr:Uncharacterised protein [Escherichia coli]
MLHNSVRLKHNGNKSAETIPMDDKYYLFIATHK